MPHPNAPDQPCFHMRPHCARGTLHLAHVKGPDDPAWTASEEKLDGDGWAFSWGFGFADEDPSRPRLCLMRPGEEMPYAVLDGEEHLGQFLNALTVIGGLLAMMARNPVCQELARNLIAGLAPAKATDIAAAVASFLEAEGVKAPAR